MSYMFIAYNPGDPETQSDYNMEYNLDGDHLIELWAKFLKLNFNCIVLGQPEYHFHVFRDGRLIFNETIISCDNENDKTAACLLYQCAIDRSKELI